MERQPYTALEIEGSGERQYAIWFGLLGGALAWLVHLCGGYGIAEFGCVSDWGSTAWLGVSHIAWLCIGLTVVTAAIACAAMFTAYRCRPRGEGGPILRREAWGNAAWLGMILSGLFVVAIVFESIPILYYLRDC